MQMSGATGHSGEEGVAGRTALVTGAGSGYCAAIAPRLVAGGAQVVAVGRRRDRLDDLVSDLGDAVHPVQLDVRDPAAVEPAVVGLPSAFSEVDILVNNAGLALGLDPAHEADLDQWRQMIETNCLGLVACTRALLPAMVERGRGHVVNMGSIAGSYPYPGGNVYGATKAFVQQFSLNLRSDLHGTGVRVTCIEPGLSEGTEFSVVRFGGDEVKAAAVAAGAAALTAGDVAEGVMWALSQPAHVNVNRVELMPVAQSPAGLRVHRDG
jgi:3-hydroxy acid dehydrogenase / malonic semialdehyde reductase